SRTRRRSGWGGWGGHGGPGARLISTQNLNTFSRNQTLHPCPQEREDTSGREKRYTTGTPRYTPRPGRRGKCGLNSWLKPRAWRHTTAHLEKETAPRGRGGLIF